MRDEREKAEGAEISEMCVVFEIDEIDLVHDVVVGSKACAPRDARARQRHATPINQTDGVNRSE